MREDYYAGLEDRYFLTCEKAKEQKFVIDFNSVPPVTAQRNWASPPLTLFPWKMLFPTLTG